MALFVRKLASASKSTQADILMPHADVAKSRTRAHALAPSTTKAYQRMQRATATFLRSYTDMFPARINNLTDIQPHELDRAVVVFFDCLEAQGYSHATGSLILAALANVPEFMRHIGAHKLALPLAHQALKGWRKLKPTIKAPPMPFYLTVAVALRVCVTDSPLSALAILVAYSAMMRSGELQGIRVSDVMSPEAGYRSAFDVGFATDASPSHTCESKSATDHSSSTPRYVDPRTVEIVVRHTKTGPNQIATVRHKQVIGLLRRYATFRRSQITGATDLDADEGKAERPFFDGLKTKTLRLHFARALDALGIGHLGFRMHSLRHGSATEFALFHPGDIHQLQLLGRWAVPDSARYCINQGQAVVNQLRVPALLQDDGRVLAAQLVHAFGRAADRFISKQRNNPRSRSTPTDSISPYPWWRTPSN